MAIESGRWVLMHLMDCEELGGRSGRQLDQCRVESDKFYRWSTPAHSTRTNLVDRIRNQPAAVQPKYRNLGSKHKTTTNY